MGRAGPLGGRKGPSARSPPPPAGPCGGQRDRAPVQLGLPLWGGAPASMSRASTGQGACGGSLPRAVL
eukprot:14743144-Alexandrium_andersonii.AAC.1